MLKWLGYLTGGRPMQIMGYSFTDIVSGLPVFVCKDTFGRYWLANGRWSLFRVAKDENAMQLVRKTDVY